MTRRKYAVAMMGALLCFSTIPAFSQGLFDQSVDWNPPLINGAENLLHEEGSASFADGSYTLMGNGNDIWNDNDEGHYVYTMQEGNFSIQGVMEWFEPGANDWSKVGLMIREEPEATDSKNFAIVLRGAGFGDFHSVQWRAEKGAASASVNPVVDSSGNNVGGGALVAISRFGNVFSAFFSLDEGATWNLITTQEIEMPNEVAVGLAITNHEENDAANPLGPNGDLPDLSVALVEAGVRQVEIGDPIPFVQVTRSINPILFEEQATLDVTLNILNGSESPATITLIEDVLPIGWTASNPSDGGTADGDVVRWENLEVPSGESSVTYQATTPPDPFEPGIWDPVLTRVQFDGNEATIGGSGTTLFLFDLLKENIVSAPVATGPITLDGRVNEAAWNDAFTFSFNTIDDPNVAPGVLLSTDNPEDTANVWALHDANNIYVAIETLDDDLHPYFWWEAAQAGESPDGFDPDVWEYDSVELYLDGNLTRLEAKEQNCLGAQMTVDSAGRWHGGNDVPGVPSQGEDDQGEFWFTNDGPCWNYGARILPDENRYVVEYQLSKASMLDSPDRTIAGFDILHNGSTGPFDSPEASREHKWGWFNTDQTTQEVFEAWDNEQGWSLIELTGDPGQAVADWSTY